MLSELPRALTLGNFWQRRGLHTRASRLFSNSHILKFSYFMFHIHNSWLRRGGYYTPMPPGAMCGVKDRDTCDAVDRDTHTLYVIWWEMRVLWKMCVIWVMCVTVYYVLWYVCIFCIASCILYIWYLILRNNLHNQVLHILYCIFCVIMMLLIMSWVMSRMSWVMSRMSWVMSASFA